MGTGCYPGWYPHDFTTFHQIFGRRTHASVVRCFYITSAPVSARTWKLGVFIIAKWPAKNISHIRSPAGNIRFFHVFFWDMIMLNHPKVRPAERRPKNHPFSQMDGWWSFAEVDISYNQVRSLYIYIIYKYNSLVQTQLQVGFSPPFTSYMYDKATLVKLELCEPQLSERTGAPPEKCGAVPVPLQWCERWFININTMKIMVICVWYSWYYIVIGVSGQLCYRLGAPHCTINPSAGGFFQWSPSCNVRNNTGYARGTLTRKMMIINSNYKIMIIE